MAPKFYIETLLTRERYKKREESWLHLPYEMELKILNMVKIGNATGIPNAAASFDTRHHHHLSSSAFRQRKYELIALVTLTTRWAVEGGLDMETAYGLADTYIITADRTDDIKTIMTLLREAPVHFATLVQENNKRKNRYSKPVLQCIEFIHSNLHKPITLPELADFVNKNPSYLSTLFKQETGQSISKYIQTKKIEESTLLLGETNMSISQIAYGLSFTSQSYFSAVFKAHFGETPQHYRTRTFREHSVDPL